MSHIHLVLERASGNSSGTGSDHEYKNVTIQFIPEYNGDHIIKIFEGSSGVWPPQDVFIKKLKKKAVAA